MSDAGPSVSVLFFASYRDRVGEARREVTLSPGATVADLIGRLREDGVELPDRPSVAVNRSYAEATRTLGDGDEVALIPPVAGG